jgi:hypothetical protein
MSRIISYGEEKKPVQHAHCHLNILRISMFPLPCNKKKLLGQKQEGEEG